MNCRPDREMMRAVASELLGTALFVYVGCGSVSAHIAWEEARGVDQPVVGIALAFGLSITVLAYTIGHHSGGHMNPMVTVAMIILQKINMLTAALYIFAQLLGAIIGAAFLQVTVGEDKVSRTVNRVIKDNTSTGGAFLMEMILSFLLVLVIAETAVSPRAGAGNNAPIAIGLSVFMAHIVLIPFTGTSINPARSFGPAVVSHTIFGDLWLFFVAPVIGGIVAALVARYIFGVCDDVVMETKKKSDEQTALRDNSSPLTVSDVKEEI